MWYITHDDVESISIGAGILGTGGGGSPYLGKIHMQSLLAEGKIPVVISPDELADDALVAEVGSMGAPTVGIEKLAHGEEPVWAIAALEKYLGRPLDALLCAEIGGANSIQPLLASAMTGKPVVDGDAMGRAFPELQMSTHLIAGVTCTPSVLIDEKKNSIVFGAMVSPRELERYARDLCVLMGCRAELATTVMSGAQTKRTLVRHTLSLAKAVGDAVRRARAEKGSMVAAVLGVTGGSELFTGKLTDVRRRTEGGFARGEFHADGLDGFRGQHLRVAIQNENLVAWRSRPGQPEEVVACVPDLICTIEAESGEPITTEQLRYGLRVTILGIPCTDLLRTPAALAVVGPAAFGYPDIHFSPMPKTPGIGIQ